MEETLVVVDIEEALAAMGLVLLEAVDMEETLVIVDIEEALEAMGLTLVAVDMEETLVIVDIEEALETMGSTLVAVDMEKTLAIMGSTLAIVDMELTHPALALEGAMMALFLRTALVKGPVLAQDMAGVGPKVESLEGWLAIVKIYVVIIKGLLDNVFNQCIEHLLNFANY